jgi:aspartate racemase
MPIQDRLIGVLGGMGPAATVDFMRQVVHQTKAERDQDHVPLLVFSDPTIPDRSASILDPGALSPVPMLRDYARRLQRAGATVIVMPCNTAHHFYGAVSDSVDVPIMHIVDAVIAVMVSAGIDKACGVAVLATAGTMSSRLYQAKLAALGYRVCSSTPAEQSAVSEAIRLIKASRIDAGAAMVESALQSLQQNGAGCAILACTELSLVMGSVQADIPLIDSTHALAVACVRYAHGA